MGSTNNIKFSKASVFSSGQDGDLPYIGLYDGKKLPLKAKLDGDDAFIIDPSDQLRNLIGEFYRAKSAAVALADQINKVLLHYPRENEETPPQKKDIDEMSAREHADDFYNIFLPMLMPTFANNGIQGYGDVFLPGLAYKLLYPNARDGQTEPELHQVGDKNLDDLIDQWNKFIAMLYGAIGESDKLSATKSEDVVTPDENDNCCHCVHYINVQPPAPQTITTTTTTVLSHKTPMAVAVENQENAAQQTQPESALMRLRRALLETKVYKGNS